MFYSWPRARRGPRTARAKGGGPYGKGKGTANGKSLKGKGKGGDAMARSDPHAPADTDAVAADVVAAEVVAPFTPRGPAPSSPEVVAPFTPRGPAPSSPSRVDCTCLHRWQALVSHSRFYSHCPSGQFLAWQGMAWQGRSSLMSTEYPIIAPSLPPRPPIRTMIDMKLPPVLGMTLEAARVRAV